MHRILQGAPAGFESTLLKGAWSKEDDGKRAAVGGADRMVTIWEVESGRILYKVSRVPFFSKFYCSIHACLLLQLPGHKGTVSAVDFHPKEPISTSFRTYNPSLFPNCVLNTQF